MESINLNGIIYVPFADYGPMMVVDGKKYILQSLCDNAIAETKSQAYINGVEDVITKCNATSKKYPGETVIVRSTSTKSFKTIESTFVEIRSKTNGSANNPCAPELDIMPGDEVQIFIKKRGGKNMGKIAGSTTVQTPEVKMIKVQSSTIAAIGHDGREFGNLRIQFCNKQGVLTSTYEYADVPKDFFDSFMTADSKGTFLSQYKWKPVMSKYRKL